MNDNSHTKERNIRSLFLFYVMIIFQESIISTQFVLDCSIESNISNFKFIYQYIRLEN